MSIEVLPEVRERMKTAGWTNQDNYFYKRLGKYELVIEIHEDNIFLDLFNRKSLEQAKKRQIYNSVTEALEKSLIWVKKYVTGK